jgi:HSP20 family protein
MTLIRRTNNGFPAFPSFFDDFFTRDLGLSNRSHTPYYGDTTPAVNIRENDDEYTVEVAAPGLEKNDFKLELENDVLTISSEKEHRNEDSSEGYSRREFRYASFKRSFTLPENAVEDSKVKAEYTNGVLSVHLPKKEEAKPKPVRTIKIG